jgi:hypothetical protein
MGAGDLACAAVCGGLNAANALGELKPVRDPRFPSR